MLAIAIVSLLSFTIGFILICTAFYLLLYGFLIFSYIFLWSAQTRTEICPHGLLSAILLDK